MSGSSASTTDADGTHKRSSPGARVAARALALLLLIVGLITPTIASEPALAQTRAVEKPEVFSLLAYNKRIDDAVDVIRASLVLRVPHGVVDEKSGDLIVNKERGFLRVAYDRTGDSADGLDGLQGMRYIKALTSYGANVWSKNTQPGFTIHKVIRDGANDYLVISVEGKMEITTTPESNVPGGKSLMGNLYFGFDTGTPAESTTLVGWIDDNPTVREVEYRAYSSARGPEYKAGPIAQMPVDNSASLWTKGHANWAQVLDWGLTGHKAGIFPSNAASADITNYAFGTAALGPAGSVSTSFWYAWVHENGTLVTDINTAPIRVTGVTPHGTHQGTAAQLVKNVSVKAGNPTLAYTPEAAAQGLTTKVAENGDIDFTTAGGNGYYRLLIWPESENPKKVTADNGAPLIRYAKTDLFNGNVPTARALDEGWPVASAFYKYDITRPAPPVITVPAEGSTIAQNTKIVISGTGLPGHSITLKLRPGGRITDPEDASLETLVDGELSCKQEKCEIVVAQDGTWSYTYEPKTPLADGHYTAVAWQTEQDSVFNVTSHPSNPDAPENPTAWGSGFDIDTVAPAAPMFVCPASPTTENRPELHGSGVEAGSTVRVYLGDKQIGTATISGDTWTYTPQEDLPSGRNELTVTQVDPAGNESAHSAPPCVLEVFDDVAITGLKSVAPVADPAPGLASAAPENWEIVVSDDSGERVISGGAEVQLKRGEAVTVGERLRLDPAPDPTAALYARRGEPACVDANGTTLAPEIFDPASGKLLISNTDQVAGPVRCTITNQASQATLVTKRLGGQTTAATDGLKLSGAPEAAPVAAGSTRADAADPGATFALDADTADAVVHPGGYALTAEVPSGRSVIGIERLNLADTACAATASKPTTAPESCWVEADEANASIGQGAHEVFRVVSAEPGEMPVLPLTGGRGSLLFTASGLGTLAAAAGAALRGRWRRIAADVLTRFGARGSAGSHSGRSEIAYARSE
ncbi:hypothetical protein JD292_08215 [Leucobacter sp. CSA2]|uniref:Bacterial Ig-like domain-containing protein n=1 Tax=Leucobacter edaphi TaxID=2796472 RepID=A0A934UYF0_9MICO|nr:Ig-like domain-containing protein [Leucobacter edaphi]MBK0422057.1 hypothetical protein [Leucobacter edaphi]